MKEECKRMKNKERKNKKMTEGEGFTLASGSPLGLSIGALLGVSGKTAESAPDEAQAEASASAPRTPPSAAEKSPHAQTTPGGPERPKISKVALQRQRAGRGGKTVTLVILPQDYRGDRAALAKELRKALGCGSAIEDGKIVLQGDIADRAEAWFAKKGVSKITKSA